MTSSWTVRILAGLLVGALIVLGVSLLAGGSDSEDDGAGQPVAAEDDAGSVAAQKPERRPGSSAPGRGGQGEGAAEGEAAAEAGEELRRLRQERAAANAMTEDEREAKVNAQRFYEILGAETGDRNSADFDSAAFCDLMSEEAREQTVDYVRRSSGIDQEWDCESSVEMLVVRSKRTGGFKQTQKAKIVGVNAEGDRATATVRFGKGPLTSIPLVKEDGEWKLGTGMGG